MPRATAFILPSRLLPVSPPGKFSLTRIPSLLGPSYLSAMGLRCLFRRHRPMLSSIVRRQDRYTALCDDCGMPIERGEKGRWASAEALVSRQGRAA